MCVVPTSAMIGGSYIALTSRPNLLKTMPYSKVFVNCASRQRSVISCSLLSILSMSKVFVNCASRQRSVISCSLLSILSMLSVLHSGLQARNVMQSFSARRCPAAFGFQFPVVATPNPYPKCSTLYKVD